VKEWEPRDRRERGFGGWVQKRKRGDGWGKEKDGEGGKQKERERERRRRRGRQGIPSVCVCLSVCLSVFLSVFSRNDWMIGAYLVAEGITLERV
jgi:hypothetical protein